MPEDFWKGRQSSREGANPIHRFFEELYEIQENFVRKNGDAPLPLPPPRIHHCQEEGRQIFIFLAFP